MYDNDPIFASFYKKHTIELASEIRGLAKDDKDITTYKIRDLFLILKSEISGSYIQNLKKYINQHINDRNYNKDKISYSENEIKKFRKSVVYMLNILQVSK